MQTDSGTYKITGVSDCGTALPAVTKYITSGLFAEEASDDAIPIESATITSAACTGAGDAVYMPPPAVAPTAGRK